MYAIHLIFLLSFSPSQMHELDELDDVVLYITERDLIMK